VYELVAAGKVTTTKAEEFIETVVQSMLPVLPPETSRLSAALTFGSEDEGKARKGISSRYMKFPPSHRSGSGSGSRSKKSSNKKSSRALATSASSSSISSDGGEKNWKWTMDGILRRTGVKTVDGRYFCSGDIKRCNATKYGFRNGTVEEAKLAGLELEIDLSSALSMFRPDLNYSSSSSPATINSVCFIHPSATLMFGIQQQSSSMPVTVEQSSTQSASTANIRESKCFVHLKINGTCKGFGVIEIEINRTSVSDVRKLIREAKFAALPPNFVILFQRSSTPISTSQEPLTLASNCVDFETCPRTPSLYIQPCFRS